MNDLDYTEEIGDRGRKIRRYSFQLKKNVEYAEDYIATTMDIPASTDLRIWIGKSGRVIGLDFIQIIDPE